MWTIHLHLLYKLHVVQSECCPVYFPDLNNNIIEENLICLQYSKEDTVSIAHKIECTINISVFYILLNITPQPLYNTVVGVQSRNHIISKQKCIDYKEK